MAGTCGPFGDYSPYIRSFTIIPETLQREVVMIHPDHIPHDIPIISLYPIISWYTHYIIMIPHDIPIISHYKTIFWSNP